MNLRSREALCYDDVLLVPKMGKVKTRKEVSTKTKLTNRIEIDIPIVAAPMSSVVNGVVAETMASLGGSAFIHRNQESSHQIAEWRQGNSDAVGCAIGITESYTDRMKKLYDAGCRLFCLDIAHGHSLYVEKWLNTVPSHVADSCEFVFGSIATGEAVEWFLNNFYVGAFRVGIGPGAACTTREKTGHGVPQLTAVAECAEAADVGPYAVPIIADGGINTSGDIVKALAAGASSVMIGRLLAGAEESPHKGVYYGMASERAKEESNCTRGFTEGIEAFISVDGSLQQIIDNLMFGIKSGISYSGGSSIEELQYNHEFVRVTATSSKENGVRV